MQNHDLSVLTDEWNCTDPAEWGTRPDGYRLPTKRPKVRRRKTTIDNSFSEAMKKAAAMSKEEKEKRRRRHYATQPTKPSFTISTEEFICPHNLFTCKNKECILSKFRCNGK